MSELEFDGFKFRRPRMEIPDLMKELEDIREELHRVETPNDVKSLLQKLTDRAVDAMSHAKELEALVKTMKEAADTIGDFIEYPDEVFDDMVEPLRDFPMDELQQAVGRLPDKKPEFQEVLDDVEGLFGAKEENMSMLAVQVKGLDLPSDPNAPKSKSLMYLGDMGVGVCDEPALNLDFETQSGFSDKDADDLINQFLGV